MSMLQAQCDELRAMAESVGLAMPQAATLMMEAADTIWELRGSVHRERAEADRLREELDRMTEAARVPHPWSMGGGDFYVWYDPETMTTTVRDGDRTEQVSEMVGEALAAIGRYIAHVQEENEILRASKRWTYLGDIKEWGVDDD